MVTFSILPVLTGPDSQKEIKNIKQSITSFANSNGMAVNHVFLPYMVTLPHIIVLYSETALVSKTNLPVLTGPDSQQEIKNVYK